MSSRGIRPLLLGALLVATLLTAAGGAGRAAERDEGPTARIEAVLDSLHRAAAEGDEETYFGLFTPEAIFLGTDAGERWTIEEFRAFALPYFERDSAWTYTPTQRHVTLLPDGRAAFFDELLDQEKYGVCRGSGLLRLIDGEWRIAQYHLTFPIPNEVAGQVTRWIRDPAAGTRWIFVVRHAEKNTGEDPSLSVTGLARAKRLALILEDAPIRACFASEYRRTVETARPVSRQSEVPVTGLPARDLDTLTARLLETPTGGAALVVGHSNTVPAILARLGIEEEVVIEEGEYGALFLVQLSPLGPELLRLRF